jgi:hypothetical protein
MTRNRIVSILLVICVALTACNLPSDAATEAPLGEASPTFTPVASPTPTPVTATATVCSPLITTNTDANVRNGPGTVYSIAGVIPTGGTAPVAGKNFDGTWWYIQFAGGNGGFAWIAGSVTTATCIPATLSVIAAPPTPVIPPTNTPTPTNTLVPTVTPTVTPTVPPSATPTFTATPTLFIPPFPIFTMPCFPLFGC